MPSARSSRFSPRIVAPDVLESLFVGRRPVLERLVEDLMTTVASGGARFELVVGPRGAGKSHLIALVGHRLARHPQRGDLVLLELAEEEYPASLVDLVARLIAVSPESEGLPTRQVQLARLREQPLDLQLETAIAMLTERVRERPVVLVIENIDRVFDAIGTTGQSRLRGLLQERRRWSVVASSASWSWAFGDVRAPFYRTFHKVELPPFDEREAHGMLVRLAEVHGDGALLTQLRTAKGFARVRALRFLVGGSPRAMALLFPFLRSGRLDDIEGALLDLADELTPYFQDQVSRLPPGQRPYVEHLLASWTPLSVAELAALTFSTPQTASGQLRYLVRDRIVVASTVGRQRFYEIGEPLHRLAAAMKRPERLPAVIARFLSVWLEHEELRQWWMADGGDRSDRDPLFRALNPLASDRIRELELADRLAALQAAAHLGVMTDVDASVWVERLQGGDLAAMEVALGLVRERSIEAARLGVEALREHSDHSNLRELTGHALWHAGRGRESLPHAEWLVARHPRVVRYRRDLVDLLVHLDRADEALEMLRVAPGPGELQGPWIKALAATGRWEEAADLAQTNEARFSPMVVALQGAARGEPIHEEISESDGGLLAFFLRQIADLSDRSAVVRRTAVFRTAGDSWRATIERSLTVALEEDASFQHARPGWGHVVDALGDLGLLHPRFVVVAHALLALPDPAPFLRLAASERAWIRAVLADSDPGRALPGEPH